MDAELAECRTIARAMLQHVDLNILRIDQLKNVQYTPVAPSRVKICCGMVCRFTTTVCIGIMIFIFLGFVL